MKNSRRGRTGLLGFEGLETKTLMAVDVAYRADWGYLTVTGSESADVIQIQEGAYGPRAADGVATNAFLVIVGNAQGQELQRRVIPTLRVPVRINIDARGGNDIVWCSTRTQIYAELGDGDDTMQSGSGNDHLYGNQGNDTIFGGDGDDAIRGYEGGDRLSGGRGNDQLYGHEGFDYLFGDDGNDSLFGGDNGDELSGGAGNDELWGDDWGLGLQPGSDILRGGDGDDRLFGGAGGDILLGERGADLLNGESGADQLQGDLPTDPDEEDRIVGGDDRDVDTVLDRGARDILIQFYAGVDVSERPRRRA
jgi:Ca2+-binding RTX toxin-like protein